MKWYERRPERCRKELMLIKQTYSKARIFLRKGKIAVFLKIRGRKMVYLIKVIYTDSFPCEQPKAFIVEPNIKQAPHRWGDGHLSIHGSKEPPEISGKIILDWSIKWIEAYENWLDTGKWSERMN